MSARRFRFGRHDAITIGAVRYRWDRTGGAGHVFERLAEPAVFETFADDELAEAAKRQDWAYERDALSPGRARARAIAGPEAAEGIPKAQLPVALWRLQWVEGFCELERKGEATRSDASMKAALEALAPRMLALAIAKMPLTATGRAKRGGTAFTMRRPPSMRTFRRWFKAFEAGGRLPAFLVTRYGRCGGRERELDLEIEALIEDAAAGYAVETRPTRAACHLALKEAVDELSGRRAAKGLPPLACPSAKALGERIRRLGAFEVHAARHGLEAAKRMFGLLGEGVDVTRAGQRVEMDECEMPLHTLMIRLGVWESLSKHEKSAVERIRVWVCVALDAATRCILGLSIARTANAENACAALDMVMRDKTAVGRASGSASP